MTSPASDPDARTRPAQPMATTGGARWLRAATPGLVLGVLGFFVSTLGHVAVVVWGLGLWDAAQPFAAKPPAAVMVELVPEPWKAKEAPEEPAQAAPQPPPAPAPQPAADAPPPLLPFPTPGLAMPADPPAPPDTSTAAGLAQMLHVPVDLPDSGDGGGAPSERSAKLSRDVIGAFKDRVQTCWTTPPEAADDRRVRVLIRIAIRRDGRLNGDPALVQGIATPAGPAVAKSAIAAVKECQPYAFLPAETYRQWRLLEVGFSANGVL